MPQARNRRDTTAGFTRPPAVETDLARDSSARERRARRVLVVDADDALFELIAEWLTASAMSVIQARGNDFRECGEVDLIVIDVPFPRHGGARFFKLLANGCPGIPILVLSSTFFAGVESNGAVARTLGVAGVLPKPLKRDALIAAVKSLLP